MVIRFKIVAQLKVIAHILPQINIMTLQITIPNLHPRRIQQFPVPGEPP
jgi:hypothetical protein